MTIADKFFSERAGKYIDDDGAYGAQCMDLYADYQRNYLKVTVKGAPAAKDTWNSYNTSAFTKIANTPSFVPKRGDVGVFNMGTYGHICICTGEGNTNYFVSLDQNWDSPWDGSKPSRYVSHNYNTFLGVLRPNQDVNFDQDAYNAQQAAITEENRIKTEKAQAEADAAAKTEAERVAAEQKKLAEEQAKLEVERLAKIEADRIAAEQLATEEIKTQPGASTEVTDIKIGEDMNIAPRFKSPVVWTSILAQILLVVGLFMPQVSDIVKVVGTALVETLTLIGVLNNPSDPKNF